MTDLAKLVVGLWCLMGVTYAVVEFFDSKKGSALLARSAVCGFINSRFESVYFVSFVWGFAATVSWIVKELI